MLDRGIKKILLICHFSLYTFMVYFIETFLQVVTNGTNGGFPTLPPITVDNLFSDLTAGLIFFTLLIAVTVRTNSEFIEKWIKGEIQSFDRKYIATAIIAFFTALPLAMATFADAARFFLSYYGTWGLIGGLAMVAVYGYGWNHGTNKLASLVGHFYTKKNEGESQSQPQSSPTTTETPPPNP